MEKQIEIYTLDYCPFCQKAKMFLNEHKVNFSEISCEDDEENMREFLTKKFNLPAPATFPQIIIDGKNIGGYSDMIEKYNNKELVF